MLKENAPKSAPSSDSESVVDDLIIKAKAQHDEMARNIASLKQAIDDNALAYKDLQAKLSRLNIKPTAEEEEGALSLFSDEDKAVLQSIKEGQNSSTSESTASHQAKAFRMRRGLRV